MEERVYKSKARGSSEKNASSNLLDRRLHDRRFRASSYPLSKVDLRNGHPLSEAKEREFRQPKVQKIHRLRPDARCEQICEKRTNRYEKQNIAKRDDVPGHVLEEGRTMSRRSRGDEKMPLNPFEHVENRNHTVSQIDGRRQIPVRA